jgi:LuxR family maltose regulon positive regulatory protein
LKNEKILQRERINGILSAIHDYPLTIVEAPMGFGKTMAVRSFFASANKAPLWITFLDSEKSTSFFWDKFVVEVGRLDEHAASRLQALGFPVDAPQFTTVMSVLCELDYTAETVLVIDDCHLLPDLRIIKFIYRIIAERMDNFHIVIITRDTTNLNFPSLLAKGMCHVISQQQLKFTGNEIRDYCLMMADSISDDDMELIGRYTDGWISLIYLILLGLEQGIPVGMNNTIDELIESALFKPYDEHIQNFLLELSIMDVFTAKQALFVTQEEHTYDILRRLHRENAFVNYDESSKTYKIHNVLLDFLRQKANFSPEILQELHRRLGAWHLERKEFSAAYGHLYRAGDTERILAHLDHPDHNVLTVFEGFHDLFGNTPQEVLARYPLAYLRLIFVSILKGNTSLISDCAKRLDRLQQVYEGMDDIDVDDRNHIIAEIMIVRKFTTFNVLEPSNTLNEKIIRLLTGRQSRIMPRGGQFTFGSPHLLYIYFRDRGTFKEMVEIVVNKMMAFARVAHGCGAGSEYLTLAEYDLETGALEAAEQNSFKAIYKARTKAQTNTIICASFNLIRLYILQGKIAAGMDMLKQLEQTVLAINDPILNTTIDMCKGYLYACLGQAEKIPCWLQAGDMTAAEFFYQGLAFNYIVYGKAVMVSKRYVELEVLSESFREHFSTFSNQLGFIHNQIFEVVAKHHLYGMAAGTAALQEALSQARADDIVMPFAENAPHLMDMLKALAGDTDDEYIKKILLYSERYMNSLTGARLVKVRLSPRETEVLRLSAEGLTRDEIAGRLFVSQGTVKTHLQNIYQKLEVSGKVPAIKIARMHGLI